MGKKFKNYSYGTTPRELPVDGQVSVDHHDELVEAAGFSPDDEEVVVVALGRPWRGHPAGAYVVTGPTCPGHPFAVQTIDSMVQDAATLEELSDFESVQGLSLPEETYAEAADRLAAEGDEGGAAIYAALERRWWEFLDDSPA